MNLRAARPCDGRLSFSLGYQGGDIIMHTPEKIPYVNYKGLKGDNNPLYAIFQIRDFFIEIRDFFSCYKGFCADKEFFAKVQALQGDEK